MASDTIQRANDHALGQLEELCRYWLPQGRRNGNEWKCGGVSGVPGDSLGVNLRTGVWKDFASGEGGSDPVSLLAAVNNITMMEAARTILGEQHQKLENSAPARKNSGDWVAQPCGPEGSVPTAANFKHYKHGEPFRIWEYFTAEGRTAGYVCRFNLAEGKKEVLPMAFCRHTDGREEWRYKAMTEPRPLYNLKSLVARLDVTVIVVEGEKTADALQAACPQFAVVTWSGGAQAMRKTDFSPLNGRTVILWPDRDRHCYDEKSAPTPAQIGTEKPWLMQVGRVAMMQIAAKLSKCQMSLVNPPADALADGWDAFDAVAEGRDMVALLRDVTVIKEDEVKPKVSPPPPPPSDKEPHDPRRMGDLPFQLLGVCDDKYFYLPDNGEQILAVSASAHTKNFFFQLASMEDWMERFGASWDKAASDLIQRNQSLPKFDSRRVRGRGCWVDGDRVVYHAGNSLHVDGEKMAIRHFTSKVGAVYSAGLEIAVDQEREATDLEAAQFRNICENLAWERRIFGTLLAGWCAIAPICGALNWRPHIWITGPSGSGKSWVMHNIIVPMVGKSALVTQGISSEAGIRQTLGKDARPVVFDEAESDTERTHRNLEGVLELARQASSESEGGIIKGSQSGIGIEYLVRSAFCFGSIGVAAVKRADTSRISLLHLKKADPTDAAAVRRAQLVFEEIQKECADTIFQPGFCARVRSRAIKHAATIRANAITFSDVAAQFLGDKRSGDQMGALLAGAFSLHSTKLETPERLMKWMQTQDWNADKVDKTETDEIRCLNHLFGAQIRFDGTSVVRSVEDLIASAIEGLLPAMEPEEYKTLLRHGIRVNRPDRRVMVANQHEGLERIFHNTPWMGGKWKQQLSRVNGARLEGATKFGAYSTSRAVSVPIPA